MASTAMKSLCCQCRPMTSAPHACTQTKISMYLLVIQSRMKHKSESGTIVKIHDLFVQTAVKKIFFISHVQGKKNKQLQVKILQADNVNKAVVIYAPAWWCCILWPKNYISARIAIFTPYCTKKKRLHRSKQSNSNLAHFHKQWKT